MEEGEKGGKVTAPASTVQRDRRCCSAVMAGQARDEDEA